MTRCEAAAHVPLQSRLAGPPLCGQLARVVLDGVTMTARPHSYSVDGVLYLFCPILSGLPVDVYYFSSSLGQTNVHFSCGSSGVAVAAPPAEVAEQLHLEADWQKKISWQYFVALTSLEGQVLNAQGCPSWLCSVSQGDCHHGCPPLWMRCSEAEHHGPCGKHINVLQL